MWEHLWTSGPQPTEYLELRLRREIYHCTPDAFRTIALADILADLTCLDVEAKVRMQRMNQRRG